MNQCQSFLLSVCHWDNFLSLPVLVTQQEVIENIFKLRRHPLSDTGAVVPIGRTPPIIVVTSVK